MRIGRDRWVLACLLYLCSSAFICGSSSLLAAEPPKTGPETEKRFPLLKVPEGFRATLFACDPLIEYPSVIATGPRVGSLFVAADTMTGLGTDIVKRDEIRLIEDIDGDGYADKATVVASGLNSVQGLAYHDGTLYVMHAPYLSALRDTKGTGKFDERRDLVTGLGLPPEKDQIRLHNANGVVMGHDGWLYLAIGDRGCDVKRIEGDRLVYNGGGILRCRPDGRDLHVFATGMRNIYDVALDEDLNVFVRDNENDGGDYKIRVCHSFFGADHGYPYLYWERPDEALAPLADLGLGSSAGGICYLETQFPAECRGNLFFCEWGRAVVRYPLKRAGSSFATPKEIDFAAGDPKDPYGFKPTDLVVDRDGSLFISDWADGQRPRRGRGRIYHVRYVGNKDEKPAAKWKEGELPARLEDLVGRLDAESYTERCRVQQAIERRGKDGAAAVADALAKKRLGVRGRLHAVWVLAKVKGPQAAEELFALAKDDPEPRVQAQAIRALADLSDPTFATPRLVAPPGTGTLAEKFAPLAVGRDPRVQLEVVIALGRLRWADAPAWLRKNLTKPDLALAHAAQWALRRLGNWQAVLQLLDGPDVEPIRAIARRAVADQYDKGLVDGLIGRLAKTPDPTRRREYADLLTRVYKKPAEPWTYWGFRPPPRPAKTVAWERTEAIEQALTSVLADANRDVRLAVLRRMVREKVAASPATLGRWLKEERDPETVAVLLNALREKPGSESRSSLEGVIQDRKQTTANRLLAVTVLLEGIDGGAERLPVVAEAVEDGPILAELLRAAGTRKVRGAAKLLLARLSSPAAEVRAAAAGALAELDVPEARDPIRKLLGDDDARVRAAAALAVGKLTLKPAVDQLLKLTRDPTAEVRRSSLEALRLMREPRTVPAAVTALGDPELIAKALECLADLGGPEQAGPVAEAARRQPSGDVLAAAGKVLTSWAAKDGLPPARRQEIEQALAEIHGGSGVLLGWHVLGPIPSNGAELVTKLTAGRSLPTSKDADRGWRVLLSTGTEARVRLGSAESDGTWLAYCELSVPEAIKVEFSTAASAPATVWLNGKVMHERDRPAVPGPYPERFEAALVKGRNQVLVRILAGKGTADFQLRFRRKSNTALHERLTLAALSRAGNPEHGRQIFLDAEKSQCMKCHRVGEQGERVGPELTGLGGRFSKAYIVESVLEPSRTISPSFESVVVELKNGKVVNGIKIAETPTTITLMDNQIKKYEIAKSDIEEQKKSLVSAMPDGLETRLTEDEFVDLMSFLANLKEQRGR